MGEIVQPLQDVAGGFRSEDTERKLNFIEELHSLGVSKHVDLPQVCLF
jgi:hypothetical protein